MSLAAGICPRGDRVRRNSLGLFLCSGVSTTPGATTFTRMPCGAYSIARLREIALIPPFVIIGTDAVRARKRMIDDRSRDAHLGCQFWGSNYPSVGMYCRASHRDRLDCKLRNLIYRICQ